MTIKTIIPPENGWEPRTYYWVEIKFSSTNVKHHSIFYSGFLNGNQGRPGGYNQLWNPTYDGLYKITDVFYMRVISKIERVEVQNEAND